MGVWELRGGGGLGSCRGFGAPLFTERENRVWGTAGVWGTPGGLGAQDLFPDLVQVLAQIIYQHFTLRLKPQRDQLRDGEQGPGGQAMPPKTGGGGNAAW